jgi:hypothetical protein
MDKKVISQIRQLDAFKVSDRPDEGTIMSRLKHSVILSYGGEGLVIPPRGKRVIANKKLLGALPKGVVVV